MSEAKNDAKEFLKQARIYDTHIQNKLEELHRLKTFATKITSSMKSDVVSGGGGDQDKIGNAVAKIIDLEQEINQSIDNYVDKKREISKVIEQVPDRKQVAVLHKRYILFENWEQIACEMGYTYRNVCIIHGRALQTVTELLKGTDNDEG